jgi:hypothetical protein
VGDYTVGCVRCVVVPVPSDQLRVTVYLRGGFVEVGLGFGAFTCGTQMYPKTGECKQRCALSYIDPQKVGIKVPSQIGALRVRRRRRRKQQATEATSTSQAIH